MSVGGQDPATRIAEYMSGIPSWAKDGSAGLELQGCLLEIGDDGRALSIKALRLPCADVLEDKKAEAAAPKAGPEGASPEA